MLPAEARTSSEYLANQIPTPIKPASEPDKYSSKEEARLKAGEHVKYLSRQYADDLKTQIEYFKCRSETFEQELKIALPRLAEIQQATRSSTLSTVYSSVLIAVGGSAISAAGYFDKNFWIALFGLGWLILIAGIVIQVVSSAFGWPKNN